MPGGGTPTVVRFDSRDAPEWLAARLALTGLSFTVREPGSLAEAARMLGARLVGAGSSRTADGPIF